MFNILPDGLQHVGMMRFYKPLTSLIKKFRTGFKPFMIDTGNIIHGYVAFIYQNIYQFGGNHTVKMAHYTRKFDVAVL